MLSMGAYVEEGAMGIEVVNTEQAAAWDGHEGDVWTEQADRYDRASRRIWQRFVDAQLVGRGDRVLDVGCGTGGPTRDVARLAPEGHVHGDRSLDADARAGAQAQRGRRARQRDLRPGRRPGLPVRTRRVRRRA